MKEINQIDMWSLAKIFGLVGLVLGIINSVVAYVAFKGLFGNSMQGMMNMMTGGMTMDAKVLLSVPLINALMYFLFGIIFALVYNFLAKRIGGFKIEIK